MAEPKRVMEFDGTSSSRITTAVPTGIASSSAFAVSLYYALDRLPVPRHAVGQAFLAGLPLGLGLLTTLLLVDATIAPLGWIRVVVGCTLAAGFLSAAALRTGILRPRQPVVGSVAI